LRETGGRKGGEGTGATILSAEETEREAGSRRGDQTGGKCLARTTIDGKDEQ